jgi:hypothetical protein
MLFYLKGRRNKDTRKRHQVGDHCTEGLFWGEQDKRRPIKIYCSNILVYIAWFLKQSRSNKEHALHVTGGSQFSLFIIAKVSLNLHCRLFFPQNEASKPIKTAFRRIAAGCGSRPFLLLPIYHKRRMESAG